jgi:hypothetical protein
MIMNECSRSVLIVSLSDLPGFLDGISSDLDLIERTLFRSNACSIWMRYPL